MQEELKQENLSWQHELHQLRYSNLCFLTLSVVVHCCSVGKSYLTLCDPVDCSMPGFSVHYLPDFAQTHVH